MTGMGGAPGPGDSSIVAEFRHDLATQSALVLLVAVLLFVGWNQLRAMQYRRSVARGEPVANRRTPLSPEPAGRRFLRLAFGLLWLFDGLLQLQSGMPLGLPTDVIQPSAATSPTWVQHLVNSGVTIWTSHPAAAAASTVWIQIGIGVLLLVAPRGWWSRGAGVASAGWGLIVWSFGNAFGGIFAPGLTLLFGAPGAVLFYVVAGGLVALPDRSWSGRRIGRLILGSTGVLLLGFGVLQAWPGRGFWQGAVGRQPGTLTAMVNSMAQTSQPHLLASLVSSFGSFDRSHGWGVNLFAVVAMLGIGGPLLGVAIADRGSGSTRARRILYPVMVVLAVLCIADWVLIEDFGFWGGVGTDPNSMLPLLFVTTGGYLALTRSSDTVPVGSSEHDEHPGRPMSSEASSSEGASGPDPDSVDAVPVGAAAAADVSGQAVPSPLAEPAPRPWWDRVDANYAGRVAASIGALAILVLGAAPMTAAAAARSADPQIAEATDGAPNVTAGPAPGFRLIDQHGTSVSLAQFRGSTVVLTFLDPVCTTDCPIIAQELRVTASLLGSDAAHVQLLAVAANPVYHSVANVSAFTRQEDLDTLPNWHFVTGTQAQLESVWNAYGVTVQTAPAGGMVAHDDVIYLIDSHGVLRRIINSDPGAGDSTTQSSFSGLLANQITQVQHQ